MAIFNVVFIIDVPSVCQLSDCDGSPFEYTQFCPVSILIGCRLVSGQRIEFCLGGSESLEVTTRN